MAEYQRHPLARPHDVGQDFWAVNYAGPSLMDRQKYIDPRTGQVWESLEEALRFLAGPTDYQQWDELGRLPDDPNVEAVMPDIRAGIPPGPPGEAAFRASQEVPTILPERRITPPDVVTGLLEAPDTGVTISESTYDYDQAQREADLQRAIRREETDPPYDREAELRQAIKREETEPTLQPLEPEYKPRFEWEIPMQDQPKEGKWPDAKGLLDAGEVPPDEGVVDWRDRSKTRALAVVAPEVDIDNLLDVGWHSLIKGGSVDLHRGALSTRLRVPKEVEGKWRGVAAKEYGGLRASGPEFMDTSVNQEYTQDVGPRDFSVTKTRPISSTNVIMPHGIRDGDEGPESVSYSGLYKSSADEMFFGEKGTGAGDLEYHEPLHRMFRYLWHNNDLIKGIPVTNAQGEEVELLDLIFPKKDPNCNTNACARRWKSEPMHDIIYSASKYGDMRERVGAEGFGEETNLSAEANLERNREILRLLNDALEDTAAKALRREGLSPIPEGEIPHGPSIVPDEGLITTTPEEPDTPNARELKGQEAADARKRKLAEDKRKSRLSSKVGAPRTTFEKTLVDVGTFPNDTAEGRKSWYGVGQNKKNVGQGTAYLAPDAASDYKRMNKAFKAKFGRDIRIESAYRTNLHNEALKKKGAVQTSKHKEGTALDITSKKERDWIIKNGADKYGWIWHNYKDKKGKRGTSNHFYHIGKRKTTSR